MSNTETLNKERKLSAAELTAALQHITSSDEEDLIDSDDDEIIPQGLRVMKNLFPHERG